MSAHINDLLFKLRGLENADPRSVAFCAETIPADFDDYDKKPLMGRPVVPPPRLPAGPLTGWALERAGDPLDDALHVAYEVADGMRFLRFRLEPAIEASAQLKWLEATGLNWSSSSGSRTSTAHNRNHSPLMLTPGAPSNMVACRMETCALFEKAYREADNAEALRLHNEFDKVRAANERALLSEELPDGFSSSAVDQLPPHKVHAILSGYRVTMDAAGRAELLTSALPPPYEGHALALRWSPDWPWVRPQTRPIIRTLSGDRHLSKLLWDTLGVCPYAPSARPKNSLFTDACGTLARIETGMSENLGQNCKSVIAGMLFRLCVTSRNPLLALARPRGQNSIWYLSEHKNKALVASSITADCDRKADSLSGSLKLEDFCAEAHLRADAMKLDKTVDDAELKQRMELAGILNGLAKGA